jgi:ring-1,2-phenylacetyl-CoA epoxidase subunit PaaC
MRSPTVSATSESGADLLVVADGCLVLSHRLSEWMSKAPTMEEDIALGNIALDLLGEARGLLQHVAGETGSDEDALAYFREPQEFRNPLICELPNGDFGQTILRQLFVDAWLADVWSVLATTAVDGEVRGIAEKAVKENAYHLRHSTSWAIRLGDGTEESHRRMLAALETLWPYRGEIADAAWYDRVEPVLVQATLPVPAREAWTQRAGGGWHTEHLGYLLAEMQSLARAHPGASW